ncbi:hypothetical protein [Sinimarinibacterium thermocellulolyticum]|uniref:Uncharacterized protein n=1 Tax=Sinimarinibacterium thermocellulolyticum TaxID=3170016 RepID=A0ABV2ADX5_9GAMM
MRAIALLPCPDRVGLAECAVWGVQLAKSKGSGVHAVLRDVCS